MLKQIIHTLYYHIIILVYTVLDYFQSQHMSSYALLSTWTHAYAVEPKPKTKTTRLDSLSQSPQE